MSSGRAGEQTRAASAVLRAMDEARREGYLLAMTKVQTELLAGGEGLPRLVDLALRDGEEIR